MLLYYDPTLKPNSSTGVLPIVVSAPSMEIGDTTVDGSKHCFSRQSCVWSRHYFAQTFPTVDLSCMNVSSRARPWELETRTKISRDPLLRRLVIMKLWFRPRDSYLISWIAPKGIEESLDGRGLSAGYSRARGLLTFVVPTFAHSQPSTEKNYVRTLGFTVWIGTKANMSIGMFVSLFEKLICFLYWRSCVALAPIIWMIPGNITHIKMS